jgi:hypothetical protein
MKHAILSILLLPLLAACFEDKGNYDYREMPRLTITGIPALVEVLGNAERLVVRPVVTSSTGEVIKGDDPAFSFVYKTTSRDTLARTMELDTIANFNIGTYDCWFVVTDLRTGLTATASFAFKVTTTLFEGYMVLCNEGTAERVRLDMISRVSADRTIIARNVMPPLGLPEIHHAMRIGYNMTRWTGSGTIIYLLSREGGYLLNETTFATGEAYEMWNYHFIVPPPPAERVIYYLPLVGEGDIEAGGPKATFAVSVSGNAYVKFLVWYKGSFEDPINTSVPMTAPEYRVAPFVGLSQARPGNGNTALFYDIDNKRFVGWAYGAIETDRKVLFPLADPTGALFSFQTGMELVYMESTRYSGGLVYAILKDAAGKHIIYGINMSGNGFVQEAKYENISPPDFDKATAYAFHSQYPFMFYAIGNKVYLHNLGTNTTYLQSTVALGATEEITMLKFNLYEYMELDKLSDQSEEFMSRQFELIVASYDNAAPDVNGGKLGFYPVNGTTNSVTKRIEYTGFARIVDVVYRER